MVGSCNTLLKLSIICKSSRPNPMRKTYRKSQAQCNFEIKRIRNPFSSLVTTKFVMLWSSSLCLHDTQFLKLISFFLQNLTLSKLTNYGKSHIQSIYIQFKVTTFTGGQKTKKCRTKKNIGVGTHCHQQHKKGLMFLWFPKFSKQYWKPTCPIVRSGDGGGRFA